VWRSARLRFRAAARGKERTTSSRLTAKLDRAPLPARKVRFQRAARGRDAPFPHHPRTFVDSITWKHALVPARCGNGLRAP